MSVLCFQLKEIPDLSLNKYQSLADTGVDGILVRHTNFLRLWHGICTEAKVSLHLLLCFDSDLLEGERLQLYLFLNGDEQNIKTIKPLMKQTALSDFYHFEECAMPDLRFKAGATLIKKERVANIYHELSDTVRSFHYVPEWEMNENCRAFDLYRMLTTVSLCDGEKSLSAYRIDLYPADIADTTQFSVTEISKIINGEHDIQLVSSSSSRQDGYARTVLKEYESWLTKVNATPVFRCNIYAFAKTGFHAKMILNSIGSEAITSGDYCLVPIREDAQKGYCTTSRMADEASTYCVYPKEAQMKHWSTSFTLEEAAPFFRLPALYDGETIEMLKETAPRNEKNGLFLGRDEHGYPVTFPIEDLCRHAFFTGMPGAGKTNTMLHLISELKKKKIPFLVMEPAKKEYRELLVNPENHDVVLFSPHLMSHFTLRMNPFSFVKGIRLSEHISALMEVFQGTFVLEGATYKFLSSSIQKAYEDLGWDIEDINGDVNYSYPTMQDVYDKLEIEINNSSYDGELKGNLRSFLQVRLGGLMERDAGELYNTPISTVEPEKWLNLSAVVELETLPEHAKNFFVLLVCHYILQSLRVHPKDNKTLRHVLFIEEAHNIISPSTMQSGSDSVDPKISATQYIVKMLAEVRALKEAIVIADQLPTALAVEVTKNTGLKLVHRLTAQDDREQIGTAISASSVQLEQMTTFSKGKALIHHEKTQKPFVIQVEKWVKSDHSIDFGNDKELFKAIKGNQVQQNSILKALKEFNETKVLPVKAEFEQIMASFDPDDVVSMLECLTELEVKFDLPCRKMFGRLEKLASLWNLESFDKKSETYQFYEELKNILKNLLSEK